MIGAVVEGGLKTYNRVACEGTLVYSFQQALFNCGEEVFGNRAADNSLAELKTLSVTRLELNPNITELTCAAGLLLVSDLRRRTASCVCPEPELSCG